MPIEKRGQRVHATKLTSFLVPRYMQGSGADSRSGLFYFAGKAARDHSGIFNLQRQSGAEAGYPASALFDDLVTLSAALFSYFLYAKREAGGAEVAAGGSGNYHPVSLAEVAKGEHISRLCRKYHACLKGSSG